MPYHIMNYNDNDNDKDKDKDNNKYICVLPTLQLKLINLSPPTQPQLPPTHTHSHPYLDFTSSYCVWNQYNYVCLALY